jgi:hypothetical protein
MLKMSKAEIATSTESGTDFSPCDKQAARKGGLFSKALDNKRTLVEIAGMTHGMP